MKVGFIGLGVMGRPMAGHLAGAGHALHVWARRRDSAGELPAVWCDTPAELARACEVVFTIVTASADVEHVALGPQGLIEGLSADQIVVDCSTIAPEVARKVAAEFAGRGAHFLDAPVSGGGQGAREGTLAVMAGGEAAILERVRPLIRCFGQRIVHVGPVGAGQVAKACNQMIMVAAIQAVAEALRLAGRAGVDPARVREALAGGSAASRMLDLMGDRMLRRDFAAGIEARLHHKDFGLLLDAARQAGVPLPLASVVGQQLNALMAQGWGRDDTSSLWRVLEAM